MTYLPLLQAMLEFAENYLGRPLQPDERAKLQEFCDQISSHTAKETDHNLVGIGIADNLTGLLTVLNAFKNKTPKGL